MRNLCVYIPIIYKRCIVQARSHEGLGYGPAWDGNATQMTEFEVAYNSEILSIMEVQTGWERDQNIADADRSDIKIWSCGGGSDGLYNTPPPWPDHRPKYPTITQTIKITPM